MQEHQIFFKTNSTRANQSEQQNLSYCPEISFQSINPNYVAPSLDEIRERIAEQDLSGSR
jgi:hypothetical protein